MDTINRSCVTTENHDRIAVFNMPYVHLMICSEKTVIMDDSFQSLSVHNAKLTRVNY